MLAKQNYHGMCNKCLIVLPVGKILVPKDVHCPNRLADKASLEAHVNSCHRASFSALTSDPRSMSKAVLTNGLRERGLDTRGGVAVL